VQETECRTIRCGPPRIMQFGFFSPNTVLPYMALEMLSFKTWGGEGRGGFRGGKDNIARILIHTHAQAHTHTYIHTHIQAPLPSCHRMRSLRVLCTRSGWLLCVLEWSSLCREGPPRESPSGPAGDQLSVVKGGGAGSEFERR
jgi:hypothetical protein